MNKKNIIAIASGAVVLVAATAVATGSFVSRKTSDSVYTKIKEDEAFYDETVQLMKDNQNNLPAIEDELKTRMSQLPLDQTNAIVDTLVYNAYVYAQTTTISDENAELLFQALDENHVYQPDKLEDGDFKDSLTLAIQNHAKVIFVNGTQLFDVDYEYFVDQYGDFMKPDYKAVLTYYVDKHSQSYFMVEEDHLNYIHIQNMLNQVVSLQNDYPDSDLNDVFEDEHDFWISILIGGYDQEYLFDDTKHIRPEVLEAYKSIISSTKNVELRELLKELVDRYEQTNGLETEDLAEWIRSKCGDAINVVLTPEATSAASEEKDKESSKTAEDSPEAETLVGTMNEDGSITLDDGTVLSAAGMEIQSGDDASVLPMESDMFVPAEETSAANDEG